MWIEKLQNGKFKACERYTDPMTGKERKVSVTIERNNASTRKSAAAALSDKIKAKIEPSALPDHLTVSTLIKLYLEDQKATTKPSTYRRSVFSCKNVKSILGADTLVEKLNAGYVRKRILASKKEPVTMNENLKRTKMLLRWGYRNEYVSDVSWLEKIERFKDKSTREKIRDKFLESSELRCLMNHMTVQKWKDLTLFLALTGMRIGEAFALTLDDISLSDRTIHINKSYDVVTRITSTTKTLDSTRDIYIQDELLPLIRTLRSQAMAHKFISKSDLLFQDEEGRYQYNTYRKHLRVHSLAVLGRKCTPHILRHTHTSLMAEHGIPLDVISRRLGHSDSRITKDIYFHVTDNLKKKDDALFQSVSIL